jgi:hypothetical protein
MVAGDAILTSPIIVGNRLMNNAAAETATR